MLKKEKPNEFVARLARAKGLKIKDIAERCGIDPVAFRKRMSRKVFAEEDFPKLAKVLECTEEELRAHFRSSIVRMYHLPHGAESVDIIDIVRAVASSDATACTIEELVDLIQVRSAIGTMTPEIVHSVLKAWGEQ